MITGVEVSLVSYIILFPLLLSFLTITGSVYMCNSHKIQISPSYIHCCRQLVQFNQSPSRSVVRSASRSETSHSGKITQARTRSTSALKTEN